MDIFPSSWLAKSTATVPQETHRAPVKRREDGCSRSPFSSAKKESSSADGCVPRSAAAAGHPAGARRKVMGSTAACNSRTAVAVQSSPRERLASEERRVAAGGSVVAAMSRTAAAATTSKFARGIAGEAAVKRQKKSTVRRRDISVPHRDGGNMKYEGIIGGRNFTVKDHRRGEGGRMQQTKLEDDEDDEDEDEEVVEVQGEEELKNERKRLLAAARDVVAAAAGGDRGSLHAAAAAPVFSAAEAAELVSEKKGRKEEGLTRKKEKMERRRGKREGKYSCYSSGITEAAEEVSEAAAATVETTEDEGEQTNTTSRSHSSGGRAALPAAAATSVGRKPLQHQEDEAAASGDEELDLNIVESPAAVVFHQNDIVSKGCAVAARLATHRRTSAAVNRDAAASAAADAGLSNCGSHADNTVAVRSSNDSSRSNNWKNSGGRSTFDRGGGKSVSGRLPMGGARPAAGFSAASASAVAAADSSLFLSCRAALPGSATTEALGEQTKAEKEEGAAASTRDSLSPEERDQLQRQVPKTLPFYGARRQATVSVALPASIIDNAQTQELQAALVGQIARTLTVFGIDEIVVYEDVAAAVASTRRADNFSRALVFFVRNLEYLETPQYLRKSLFPLHPDLRYAGLQNPLDAPHHLRRCEWLPYREGVVVSSATSSFSQRHAEAKAEKDGKNKQQQRASGIPCQERGEENKERKNDNGEQARAAGENGEENNEEEDEAYAANNRERRRLREVGGSWVDCGLPCHVWIPQALPRRTRVTVRLDVGARQQLKRQQQRQQQQQQRRHQRKSDISSDENFLSGTAVSRDEPPREAGLYWGYHIRVARHFSDVFKNCPFAADGSYDLTIGTSERGSVIDKSFSLPSFRHLLVVFGGLQGLEAVVADRQASSSTSSLLFREGMPLPELFSLYLNTCGEQRSRTIRTEEALPISLSLLRPHILCNNRKETETTRQTLLAEKVAEATGRKEAAAAGAAGREGRKRGGGAEEGGYGEAAPAGKGGGGVVGDAAGEEYLLCEAAAPPMRKRKRQKG